MAFRAASTLKVKWKKKYEQKNIWKTKKKKTFPANDYKTRFVNKPLHRDLISPILFVVICIIIQLFLLLFIHSVHIRCAVDGGNKRLHLSGRTWDVNTCYFCVFLCCGTPQQTSNMRDACMYPPHSTFATRSLLSCMRMKRMAGGVWRRVRRVCVRKRPRGNIYCNVVTTAD